MNELLLSELQSDQNDILQSIILIEELIFSCRERELDSLNRVIANCQAVVDQKEDPLEKSEQFINELFIEQLFIDNAKSTWSSSSFFIESAVANRDISPVLKAILIEHIALECGLDIDIVFVPDKPMLRIVCDDLFAIVFEPVTGESLNGFDLDKKLEDVDANPYKQQLNVMSKKELLSSYLTSLKGALIRESKFDDALKCVDILLCLTPDDPIERRDRGFLLHQLDCFKVAYDDYRFFVEQCPKDPAAMLLKSQLDNINIMDTTLH